MKKNVKGYIVTIKTFIKKNLSKTVCNLRILLYIMNINRLILIIMIIGKQII